MKITNYRGAVGAVEKVGDGFDQFIRVYNDTGGTATNGDVYFLSFEKDADSLSPSARPTLESLATSSVYRDIVVVNDTRGSIADQDWGLVQIRGYCPAVKVDPSGLAAESFLQGIDSSVTAGDDGAAITTDSFAIAVGAVFSTSFIPAVLFGERVLIGA